MIDLIGKWLQLVSSIITILGALLGVWLWGTARFVDNKILETIAHPTVNYQGIAMRTIRWDDVKLAERLGMSKWRVRRSIMRLKRQKNGRSSTS